MNVSANPSGGSMKLRMALISVLLAAGAGDALGQQRPGGNGPLPGDPGYGGGARQQQMPPPPRLTGGWVTNWGAIAQGTNGLGGVAEGQLFRVTAENEAVSQCTRGGGMNCKLIFTYSNQCVALAHPGGRATADSIGLAEERAKNVCNERNSAGTCRIVYSACSLPYFARAVLPLERPGGR